MPVDEKLTRVFMSIREGLERAVSGIVPPKEIEDVVQETYVRVCQSHSATEIQSPRSFMYRTARNIALNHANKAESRLVYSWDEQGESASLVQKDPFGSVLDTVCSDEQFSFFCDAVRSLPLQCRRAFVLKKVYGHSYREIGQILQISEKTVEKHISKGIRRCRNFLLERNKTVHWDSKSMDKPGGGK